MCARIFLNEQPLAQTQISRHIAVKIRSAFASQMAIFRPTIHHSTKTLPVCVRMCRFSSDGRSKALPQTWHGRRDLSRVLRGTISAALDVAWTSCSSDIFSSFSSFMEFKRMAADVGSWCGFVSVSDDPPSSTDSVAVWGVRDSRDFQLKSSGRSEPINNFLHFTTWSTDLTLGNVQFRPHKASD